jgi:NADPH:quinone reductase-like Zn-dependent oxidoreductase
MKAIQIQTFGGPESVTVTDIEAPMPGPGEVVVSVKAAALNPLDLKIIAGYMQQVFPIDVPYVPGSDFSGIVHAVGEGVTELNVGDRVFGRTAPTAGGTLAEQVRLPAADVMRIPSEMSFEQAASLPTTYGTAKQALTDLAKLKPGERVLIHGGAGGVGTMAVQVAALAGAHVIATASGRNHARVRELGAHEVLDYRLDDFTRLENIDVVLDTFGGETLEKSWAVLSPAGRIATLADFSIKARDGHEGTAVFFATATPYLADAIAQFQQGKLQIITDAIYDLADARAAMEKLATGHARGKIIVRIAG